MSVLLKLLKSEGYKPTVEQTERLESKRKDAIEWMGEKWCLHPNYKFNQKHGVEAWKSK